MKRGLFVLIALFLLLLVVWLMWPRQSGHPGFDAAVAEPAYSGDGPTVLFDEGHYNFHKSEGRYKPFADLIRSDGYRITVNTSRLNRKLLDGHDILISANALGLGGSLQMAAARLGLEVNLTGSAFDEDECLAVESWVRQGGALLLIADHAPAGAASDSLARRFGVMMSNGFARDEQHHDPESGKRGLLVYSRENGLLGEHPITEGRGKPERLGKVMTFSGQSLRFPPKAKAFLLLAETAFELPRRNSPDSEARSVAGSAQGIALEFGQGRIVVMAEAAALTSQIISADDRSLSFGMSSQNDNRQLALNILHWLSRLL
ncbi:MAG: hypothetical protein V3T83_06950 [Acidobacteriota bacterium]